MADLSNRTSRTILVTGLKFVTPLKNFLTKFLFKAFCQQFLGNGQKRINLFNTSCQTTLSNNRTRGFSNTYLDFLVSFKSRAIAISDNVFTLVTPECDKVSRESPVSPRILRSLDAKQ